MNKKKIFICCTEQSGDNICSNILSRLDLKKYIIDGVCGSRSTEFINNKYYDISDFKSIGLIEVIFSIYKYIKMIRYLKNQIINNNYDLVICIDSPDFNYHLVKSLRKSKFFKKIIQIVAPTVWAWREGRAKKFSDIYDDIFLLFDFEKKYFQYSNINATFIGHPIYHIKKRSIKNKYKYIAFLPGSRENEINKLFKYFDIIEKFLYEKNINYKIFIPTLPHLTELIRKKTRYWNIETLISDEYTNFDSFYEDVYISVTCSGTASLEIAKRNIPQMVIYKLNIFTEIILRIFIKIRYACLINIVSKKTIIPEVVNSNLTSKNLINVFNQLIKNTDFQNDQIKNVNKYLHLIESDQSPYDISVKKILTFL